MGCLFFEKLSFLFFIIGQKLYELDTKFFLRFHYYMLGLEDIEIKDFPK